MKSHTALKIALTLTSLHLSTASLTASGFSTTAEENFDKVYEYYDAHHKNLTQPMLEKIEYELKKIVDNPYAQQTTLGDAACLLYFLGCNELHLYAMKTLFNRADFNSKIYSICIKEIRRLKAEKTLKIAAPFAETTE